MGEIVLAAKVTHAPSLYLSELEGPYQGFREEAILGLQELGNRAREREADTMLVLDTHWLVNNGFHINNYAHFKGSHTSHKMPHFFKDVAYEYRGNPELGNLIAACANGRGIQTRAHQVQSLELECGTIIPMRYMNADGYFKVVSIAAWCAWHQLEESRAFGDAIREAIQKSDNRVAVLASGSLSYRFQDNKDAEAGISDISNEFYRQVDLRVLDLWQHGAFGVFIDMLPEYARKCHGEGLMHDTAMLLGMLGWKNYTGNVELVTDYFASSGTGQVNAEFPVQ